MKGAVVGGVAGHMTRHSKPGAAAGCTVGYRETNQADANKNGLKSLRADAVEKGLEEPSEQ